MQGTQTQYAAAGRETILAFKRHILNGARAFADEPQENLLRINLLEQMLNRYDELAKKGLSEYSCCSCVLHEFADIAGMMREHGFQESAEPGNVSRWPQISEADAQCYIRQRDAYMHKIAMGVFMCVACLVPLLMMSMLEELSFGLAGGMLSLVGLAGMFGMIGMGVYAMVTAEKPKDEKRLVAGRFSLGRSLRLKLEAMKEAAVAKARKRIGKGVATIVMSLIPLVLGAGLSEGAYTDMLTRLGVAGMFIMIGIGVYELVMAGGEGKTFDRLLNQKEE